MTNDRPSVRDVNKLERSGLFQVISWSDGVLTIHCIYGAAGLFQVSPVSD